MLDDGLLVELLVLLFKMRTLITSEDRRDWLGFGNNRLRSRGACEGRLEARSHLLVLLALPLPALLQQRGRFTFM